MQYYRNIIQGRCFLVALASLKSPKDGNFVQMSYSRACIEKHNSVAPTKPLPTVRKEIIA